MLIALTRKMHEAWFGCRQGSRGPEPVEGLNLSPKNLQSPFFAECISKRHVFIAYQPDIINGNCYWRKT